MIKTSALRRIKTKPELARLLGINASHLTNVLYRMKVENQYKIFTIAKRSGGTREIHAPSEALKPIQRALSLLLQDCIQEIHDASGKKSKSTLSHGFVRERSILTNAVMHLNKKNVLNIDLKDFFDSFNFGRVRGFFIANKNFQLDPSIATVIAQIACHDNKLPQGSPSSPVISNLITHSLDIRLASLAKENSCIYSRYADDITFSTREKEFPTSLMTEDKEGYVAGRKLQSEIKRAGFEINSVKTRIQYKDSRQDVTGLVVNKKPSVKNEYWRTIRSQCHSLFQTGSFTENVSGTPEDGNIHVLEGRLNFIDQVDFFNRQRKKPAAILDHDNNLKKKSNTRKLLNSRERTFSRFLYYKLFYGHDKPTIICEGKTDNVYLKAAIGRLAASYPQLARPKVGNDPYELLIRFINYTERTRFLLELSGGTSYLKEFILNFEENYNYYKAPPPTHPVILILDNDDGFVEIEGLLKGKKFSPTIFPTTIPPTVIRKAEFIHVLHNLYIVVTPLNARGEYTSVEDLFPQSVRDEKLGTKKFSKSNTIDTATEYGKEFFATKIVAPNKNSIDFSGFNVILTQIDNCIKHFSTITLAKP